MKDKLARVLVAGLIGGIVMDVFDYLLHIMKLSEYTHWHWASIVTYGHQPASFGEVVFGEMTNLIFTMILAVIFAFGLSRVIANHNLKLRGLTFGIGVWFVVNALAVMYGLPDLDLTLGLTISNLITAIIYGLTMSSVLHWLDNDQV